MPEHPNVDAIRRGYQAFSSGDVATMRSLWTDDLAYHVRGAGELDGDYDGPDEVLGFLARVGDQTGGTYRIDEVHAILADDEHGVVLFTQRAERKGRSLPRNGVNVWHLRDGKASECWVATADPVEMLAFWQ